jgi:hypothetical protein
MERAKKFTRRELILGTLGQLIPQDRYVQNILGGHDTPNPGGATDVDMLFHDLDQLGMTTLVGIDPSGELIDRILNQNPQRVRLITRLVQPNNEFDEENLMWTMNKLRRLTHPLVVPFNEPNLEGEGTDLSPEEHVHFHFMPAAKKIIEFGGKPLLTPLAPFASFHGIDDLNFFTRMLQQLKLEDPSLSWIRHNLVIADHAYAFYPGQNPLDKVVEKNRLVEQIFGFSLPIEITEGGLNISELNQHTD